MREATTFLPPRISTTSSVGISTRPILSCKLKAATRLSRLSLTFFSKPEYVGMMYHCIDIRRFRPLDVKILEQPIETELRELLDNREKHAKKCDRGDDDAG